MSPTPSVHNADIARCFDEIADLLELEGANPFRIRAYRNASRVVGELQIDLAARLAEGGELPKIAGVGEDLAGKISQICATGTCDALEELRTHFPPGITELLRLPGLGPKRAALLHEKLRIDSLEDLKRAAAAGKLHDVPGFGEKSEQKLLEAVEARLSKARRFKLAFAAQYAEPLAKYLGATVAGSYRRMRETVGDLDLLVATKDAAPVIERFVKYAEVKEILARGSTKATVVLACGLQVDLRVVAPESFGAALHYFTGSKAHNIAVRRMGMALGLKINEYGVFRGEKRIAGATEESVYRSVGLPYIEPELREMQGELQAAKEGTLPDLVTLADLQGDLHVHTDASDGRASLADMARAAKARGLHYLAITDHGSKIPVTHGLDAARLARQGREIDALNSSRAGIVLLRGIEVDILEDGTLDLPDAALARLDLVVGAVHAKFNLSRARQTQRILAAMENPRLSILAHPPGRLIDEREPYDVDMAAIMRKARDLGVVLELNAHPDRLDLNDAHCRMARDLGVRVSIGTDAHTVDGLADLRYGIGQARRGWLGKAQVLNALPLAAMKRALARRRATHTTEAR
ncbi:MAG TPA: DNA polymerase/3'-5' exonuclease PolX [Usitatibacter sp.]|nr:DNA polymerase/3'-5' exonuclease PolX [Usitatibacter sp.]